MKSSFYPPARWAFALLVAISIFGDVFLLFCYVPGSFWPLSGDFPRKGWSKIRNVPHCGTSPLGLSEAQRKHEPVANSREPAHFPHFPAVFPRARAHPLFSKNSLHLFTFPLQSTDAE